jgi:hypothetical protein
MNQLIDISQASRLIQSGRSLSIAGPESALDQLPAGLWIGGTTPYVMEASGGKVAAGDQVFVTDLTDLGTISISTFGEQQIRDIVGQAPDNGFALTIIPAGSNTHQQFAAHATDHEDAFMKPTVGWIAGVHLDDIGRVTPKVYDGRTRSKYGNKAVVAYVSLPDDQLASVEIVNIFRPDGGDVLRFSETSFEVQTCEVNGQRVNFADYVRSKGEASFKLPLVGDFAGAHINASLQSIDDATHTVHLYAPVFEGIDYQFAAPLGDHATAFRHALEGVSSEGIVLSCNCILNFLYGGLEGKSIGGIQGPVTFGEIAYQMLNQTMVVLRIR